jgi:hypothetical protein
MNKATTMAIVGGFVAGIATVIACGHVGQAGASPADCAVWEYSEGVSGPIDQFNYVDGLGAQQVGAATVLPAGWEPYAVDNGKTYMRRCKP